MIPGAPGMSAIGRFFDPPQQTSRYVVSGVTRDGVTNAVLGGCVVRVYETVTNILRGYTISDVNGNWAVEISGDRTIALRAIAYLAGSPDLKGTSVNTLLATAETTPP